MKKPSRTIRFAICLRALPEDDLQAGKVYRVLPDAKASEVDCLRVVDDSGEDYLYSKKRFLLVDVPERQRGQLLRAVKTAAT
jgi:hypothetical protein